MVYAELIGAGLLAGFLAGLLGIGGGFVVVPALLLLLPAFGIPADLLPKVAVATSLAGMVPTAASAVYAQYRRGALDCSVDITERSLRCVRRRGWSALCSAAS